MSPERAGPGGRRRPLRSEWRLRIVPSRHPPTARRGAARLRALHLLPLPALGRVPGLPSARGETPVARMAPGAWAAPTLASHQPPSPDFSPLPVGASSSNSAAGRARRGAGGLDLVIGEGLAAGELRWEQGGPGPVLARPGLLWARPVCVQPANQSWPRLEGSPAGRPWGLPWPPLGPVHRALSGGCRGSTLRPGLCELADITLSGAQAGPFLPGLWVPSPGRRRWCLTRSLSQPAPCPPHPLLVLSGPPCWPAWGGLSPVPLQSCLSRTGEEASPPSVPSACAFWGALRWRSGSLCHMQQEVPARPVFPSRLQTLFRVILSEMFNSLPRHLMVLEGSCPSVVSITSFAPCPPHLWPRPEPRRAFLARRVLPVPHGPAGHCHDGPFCL